MKNRLRPAASRCGLAAAAMLIFAIAVGAGWQTHAARAEDGKQALQETATKVVEAWAGAVASGDVEAVRKLLAPEFQILRSDGKGYDKEQYLAGRMPKIDAILSVQDVVATRHDDLMVVRYVISLKASANGGAMEQSAPRLTIFRRDGDGWLVVAHANFAHLQK